MLKRKRVSKRSTNNSRKGRNSISGSAASAGNADSADSQAASAASAAAAAAAGFDMPQLVHANAHGHPESSSTTTPSRRSKFADRYHSYIYVSTFWGWQSDMVC